MEKLLEAIPEFIKFEFRVIGQVGVNTIFYVLVLVLAFLLIKRRFK